MNRTDRPPFQDPPMSNPNDRPATETAVGTNSEDLWRLLAEARAALGGEVARCCGERSMCPYHANTGYMCQKRMAATRIEAAEEARSLFPDAFPPTLPPPVEAEVHESWPGQRQGRGLFGTGVQGIRQPRPSPQPGAPKGLVPVGWYHPEPWTAGGERKVGYGMSFSYGAEAPPNQAYVPLVTLSDCNAALAEKDAEIERLRSGGK